MRVLAGVVLIGVLASCQGIGSTTSTTLPPPTIEGVLVLSRSFMLGVELYEGSFFLEGLLLQTGMPCEGSDGLVDVSQGARLVVTNENGTVIGSAGLDAGGLEWDPAYGDYTMPDVVSDGESRDLALWLRSDCQLGFTIPLSSEAQFYTVSMGERGNLTYSHDELVRFGWFLALEL